VIIADEIMTLYNDWRHKDGKHAPVSVLRFSGSR